MRALTIASYSMLALILVLINTGCQKEKTGCMEGSALNYDPEATAPSGTCCREVTSYYGQGSSFPITDTTLTQAAIDSLFDAPFIGVVDGVSRAVTVLTGACEEFGNSGDTTYCSYGLSVRAFPDYSVVGGVRVDCEVTFHSASLPDLVVNASVEVVSPYAGGFTELNVPCTEYHEDSVSIAVINPISIL